MASTNKTTNLKLPQWIGTDHPTFSVDFNGAFETIDNLAGDMKSKLASLETDISDAKTTASNASTTASQAMETATNAATKATSSAESVTNITSQIGTKSRMTCDDFDNMYITLLNREYA